MKMAQLYNILIIYEMHYYYYYDYYYYTHVYGPNALDNQEKNTQTRVSIY